MSSKTTNNTKITSQDAEDANKYQKMDQREHVYKRPDTYVGSVEHNTSVVPIFINKTGVKMGPAEATLVSFTSLTGFVD